MSQRWCSLCYHSNRNENGIVGANQLDLHYYSLHRATRNEWPTTKSYSVKFEADNKPHLYDEVACNAPQSKNGEHIFLRHSKTEKDIINRIQYNKSYPIAWYGKPYRSSRFNHNWCLSTLWCAEQENLFTVPIEQLMDYPDLTNKLEVKHSDIMDDIMHRSPSNLSTLSFKHKSLAILRELKRCQTWIKYFLKPVNEQQDSAPNYYKIIQNPMDIESLKTLIECNNLKSPKQLCANLMLIWKNAQEFNPKHHKIHKFAVKCMTESRRLMKKYFPQLCNNNNVNNNNLATVKYNDNTRQCLLCCICAKRLELFVGFHTNCHKNKVQWTMTGSEGVNCNQCNRDLCDTSIAYYHCMACCVNNENSIFLCEVCAGDDKYNYDSKQIEYFPFSGLWVDIGCSDNEIWYEVITCYQESNQVEYEIVFSSNHMKQEGPFGKTSGTILKNNNELKFKIENNNNEHTDFNVAKLNVDHSILRFMESDSADSAESDNVYKKIKPRCRDCSNSEMLFMRKNTIPSTDIASVIYCDIHKDYYEKHRGKNGGDRCLSFNAFKYDDLNRNQIPQIAFYFTCTQCKNFDICAGCMLISVEENYKNKHFIKQEKCERLVNGHNGEPPQKRVRCTPSHSSNASMSPSHSGVDEKSNSNSASMEEYNINTNNLPLTKPKRLRSKTVAKKQKYSVTNISFIDGINGGNNRKRKRKEMENDGNNTSYKELYLIEKENNNKLALELKASNEATADWKSKYDKLYSKVQGVLLNDMKSSPPPLCT